jgi:hypothetical protein
MTYKAYKKQIFNWLVKMEDGTVSDNEATIAISALENLFTNGQAAKYNDKTVDLGLDD